MQTIPRIHFAPVGDAARSPRFYPSPNFTVSRLQAFRLSLLNCCLLVMACIQTQSAANAQITKSSLTMTRVYKGHTGKVLGVAFSPDGKTIASVGDQTLRLWDVGSRTDGQPHPAIKVVQDGKAFCVSVAFSPDGSKVVVSASTGEVAVYKTGGAEPVLEKRLTDSKTLVSALAFEPAGKWLATGGQTTSTVRIYDASRPEFPLAGKMENGNRFLFGLAFSPDGKTLTVGVAQRVFFWDVSQAPFTQKREYEWPKEGRSPRYSRDGQLLCIAEGNLVRVLKAATQEPVGTLEGHGDKVIAVDFSPDGRLLASGSYDRSLRLWSVKDCQQLAAAEGLDGVDAALAFSPDGHWIASAGNGAIVRLFKVSTNPAEPK
jgi:WD40 repeat protein